MLQSLTPEEIEFCECLYDPVCLAESLFSDYDNLAAFEENKNAHIRLYQLPLLSYEYLLDYNPNLTEKENFKLREGAGNIWCFAARKFGKTLCIEKLDLLIAGILLENEEAAFCSVDYRHIKGVLEKLVLAIENHPILSSFKRKINRGGTYLIDFKTGFSIVSINMNLASSSPGKDFYQQHFKRLYGEEMSFETEQVYSKRQDATSELGCVQRLSGMTNYTRYSPTGRVLSDLSRRSWFCNLPQFVRPNWTQSDKEQAIREHNGEMSVGFKMYVLGEVVEEGLSVIDMERVRPYYLENKSIKNFEITKEDYADFRKILIVERPKNAKQFLIAADIGETAPSEIIILFKINDKFRYDYNITLYNLTDKEQYEIFKWLGELLEADFIGLDTTEGTGRAIFRRLAEVFPKENLVWCHYTEKIAVGFEKDEHENVIIKDGKPIVKEEVVYEWSVKYLKELLYDQKLLLPIDSKLDIQLNSVISTVSGNKILYDCVTDGGDHLFNAFRVLAIVLWYNEFYNVQKIKKRTLYAGGV